MMMIIIIYIYIYIYIIYTYHIYNVLVVRWEKGLPGALDITGISPLNPAILDESCSTAGVPVVAAESCHAKIDP